MKLSEFFSDMEGWEKVESRIAKTPQIPNPETTVSPYLRAPLPLPLQYSPDTLKQYNRPGLSSFRIAPLPPSGISGIVAASAGAAQVVINNQPVTPSTSGGLSSVGLSMPRQYAVANSPLTADGEIDVTWIAESQGTFLGVPSNSSAPFPDGSTFANSNGTSVSSTLTTSAFSHVVLYFDAFDPHGTAYVHPTTGWTLVADGGGANFGVYYQATAASDTVTQASSYTAPTGTWAGFSALSNAMLSIRTSGTPVVASLGTQGGSIVSGSNFTATVVAGTALVGYCYGNMFRLGTVGDTTVTSITDSQGNLWYQIGSTYNFAGGPSPGISSFISVWFCPAPAAGSTTFTINFADAHGTGGNGSWGIASVTNLATTDGIPDFRSVSFSDVTGICPISKGGTGSSLVNTGGTSKFLRQNTLGGNVDVVRPDYPDLAGASGQLPSQYNGITLVANRFPTEYATIAETTKTANIGTSNLYNVPSTGAGLYRVSVYTVVSRAASTSSTLPDSQLIFTDADSIGVITINATPGDTGNATTTFQQATFVVNLKASTTLQYRTGNVTPYASSGGTSMQYFWRARLEYLG